MYLVAVLDWFSRYVLAWQLSNTLDGLFCLEALQQALDHGTPEIFNTDQGVQFTASHFITVWKPLVSASAWTGGGVRSTTSSLSASGAA